MIWQFGYAESGPAAAPRLWTCQEALLLHALPVCTSEFLWLSTLFPLPGMLFSPHAHGSSAAVWVQCLLPSVFFQNFLCPRKYLAYRSRQSSFYGLISELTYFCLSYRLAPEVLR